MITRWSRDVRSFISSFYSSFYCLIFSYSIDLIVEVVASPVQEPFARQVALLVQLVAQLVFPRARQEAVFQGQLQIWFLIGRFQARLQEPVLLLQLVQFALQVLSQLALALLPVQVAIPVQGLALQPQVLPAFRLPVQQALFLLLKYLRKLLPL